MRAQLNGFCVSELARSIRGCGPQRSALHSGSGCLSRHVHMLQRCRQTESLDCSTFADPTASCSPFLPPLPSPVVSSSLKEARRLASTKRALASQAKLAPPPARKPRTPKASTSTAASTSAEGGPSYLPDELFESAAADQEARLAREAEEASEAARLADGDQDKKRKRHERDDRLNIGSTSIRHLPSSVAPHMLAPAPTPRRVKKFLKNSQQQRTAAQAQSDVGKSKLAVGGQGKSWVRKEAHLTASQRKKGPAVGFVTGRLV